MRKDIFERMKLMQKEEIEPNYAELARRYGCDYRTVKKYYNDHSATRLQRKARPAKIDPYKDIINSKLALGCKFKAIYCFIKNKGFDGSYTCLVVSLSSISFLFPIVYCVFK